MSEISSHVEIKRGSNRNFGLVFATVFAIIALFPLLFSGGSVRYWLLAVAVIFALIALIRPSIFHKPNTWWFKFGLFLGAIIAPIVMMLIYFIAVAPIGITMRLFGKDLLSLKLDPNAKSYWVERTESEASEESMKNQF